MKRTQEQQKALDLLNKVGELLSQDPTNENIEETNRATELLEKALVFPNKETHIKWLDVLQGFKFWEDFESLTISIINIKPLLTYKAEIVGNLNAISCDFVGDNYIENDSYISDLFTEFADSQTSIYYCDQKKYYLEHSEQSEQDFLELYDGDSIINIIKDEGLENLICKVGAVGEFCQNERDLYECKEEIIAFLLVQHVIENSELYENVEINEIIEQIKEICTEDYDTLNEYSDYFQERTLNNENQ